MSELPTQALVKKDHLPLTRMRTPQPVPRDLTGGPSVSKNDILYALFKHKKAILLSTIAGLLAAAALFFLYPAVYESDAKLLVRYLVERSTIDPIDRPQSPGGYAPTTDTVIGAEVEILSSWDLAVETAEAVGVKRLLPHASGTPSKEAAASIISSGLTLTTHKGSNIIFVSYQNGNPEVATLVLNELVNRYFNKHLEVHRSAGAFDFVSQQTDQVRARLNQTEDALRDLKSKAGVVSLSDAIKDLSDEATKADEQLHDAEADVAEQQARLRQMTASVATTTIVPRNSKVTAANRASVPGAASSGSKLEATSEKLATPPDTAAPAGVVQQYQTLISGLQKLRQTQLDLFSKYTLESQIVKANQASIDEVENQRQELEKKYPDLPTRVGPSSEAAHLAGLQAKRDAIAARLKDIQDRIQQLSQLSPQIEDLERQKQLQEGDYKYFEATLEKARVDEALDPSKIPNISAVQRPSPPTLVTHTRNKIMLGLAGGGLALSVAFFLLWELMLTSKIRGPLEVEKLIGISPLVAVPFSRNGKPRSPSKKNGKVDTALATISCSRDNVAPWDANHFVRSYSEAIRDRLGLYFELHNLTHKPKLVGVASSSTGAGTSTLAAGLAAALSETNHGKVLLVDVNLGPDQVHPFFRGKPAYPLNAALTPNGAMDAVAENLYLATVGSANRSLAQLGLKRFFDLMPNLKASDFDYVIFDMPPLTQTSPTWGMSAFMDKVLLIVEADKDNRDIVKRCYNRLLAERDNVSVVVNKARSYGPKSLDLNS
jgi:uncharacterized protein involved in exopolysaccharide biosynthesis/Mrp family chromosome partitioning ATPase